MSKKLQLTLAMGDYEIVRALKEGTVQPDGIELTILTNMDSTTRHWRFLRNRDFDVAEVSSSSYLVARDQDMPFDEIEGEGVAAAVHLHDTRMEHPHLQVGMLQSR